jgi:hypothetical protein
MDSKDPKDSPLARQRRASESDSIIDQRSLNQGRSAEASTTAAGAVGAGAMGGNDVRPRNVDLMQMLSRAQDEYDRGNQPSPQRQKKAKAHKVSPGAIRCVLTIASVVARVAQ